MRYVVVFYVRVLDKVSALVQLYRKIHQRFGFLRNGAAISVERGKHKHLYQTN